MNSVLTDYMNISLMLTIIMTITVYSVGLITDAAKAYANSSGKDLNRLSEYAEQFHIMKALKPYLEVLL